jgi:iodotyrosine deiodinase
MSQAHFVPLSFHGFSEEEMARRAADFADELARRRTVRHFSSRPVPRPIIDDCLRAAGSAPSGANRQPWHFVAISDGDTKRAIREAAETEEHEFYTNRAPPEWLEALAPLGTDESKPFLEEAPWLIAVFSQSHGLLPDGRKVKHYYALESVGLATGLLIAAVHHAGLASLTHTPSPMAFLNEILDRPSSERPFLLLVVGYPEDDAVVPDIQRKPIEGIATFK